MTSLVEVAKAQQRSLSERADRVRREATVGSQALAAGGLGLMLQPRTVSDPDNPVSPKLYGHIAPRELRATEHELVGNVYRTKRNPVGVKVTDRGVGFRQSRVPTLERVSSDRTLGRGVFVGRSVPTALKDVLGSEAPGRRVLGYRTKSGRIVGGTPRGLAVRAASTAGVVGGGAMFIDATRKSKKLGHEIRVRSAQRAAETRRARYEQTQELKAIRARMGQPLSKASLEDVDAGVGALAGIGTAVALRKVPKGPARPVPGAVHTLNHLPKEKDSLELGVRYGRNVMGTYRQNPIRYKRVAPTVKDLRAERAAATWWSSNTKHVNQVRSGRNPRLYGRRRAETMRQMIAQAEPTNRPLYRGLSDDASRYRRGARINSPESSWTESRGLAEQYSTRRGGPDRVVLHTVGARATHIAPVTRYRNAEWVTPKADYRVTRTRRVGDVKHVYVAQDPLKDKPVPLKVMRHRARRERASGVAKSFVRGEWKPITKIPKKQLQAAVRNRQFGQRHLSEISAAKNTSLHATRMNEQMRRAMADTDKPKVFVRNAYTGKRMQVIRDGAMPGPHVNWATAPGQPAQIRLANKRTMKEIRPQVAVLRVRGSKMTTDPAAVNLHEHAHATMRRTVVSRDAAVLNRAWSKRPDLLSDAVSSTSRMQSAGSVMEGVKAGAKWGKATAKNNQWVNTVNRARNVGEEARADVMASRKLGRTFVSGHVRDAGPPDRYLGRRRTIERGMGMAPTPLRAVSNRRPWVRD